MTLITTVGQFSDPLYGFCHCGCGQKTKIAKYDRPGRYKAGEPMKYLANHCHVGGKKKEIQYVVDPSSGCWKWILALSDTGYGVLWDGERLQPAHRYFYTKYKGQIPEGKDIDHLCRNRGCVKPEHLEAVSRAVNARRGSRTKLTEEEVIVIRRLREEGVSYPDLSRRFHVSKSALWHAVNKLN